MYETHRIIEEAAPYNALHLLAIMVKLRPTWIASHPRLMTSLRARWNCAERSKRVRAHACVRVWHVHALVSCSCACVLNAHAHFCACACAAAGEQLLGQLLCCTVWSVSLLPSFYNATVTCHFARSWKRKTRSLVRSCWRASAWPSVCWHTYATSERTSPFSLTSSRSPW